MFYANTVREPPAPLFPSTPSAYFKKCDSWLMVAPPYDALLSLQLCRKGVGWLVASAAASGGQPPMVLPFVHSGMENVLPKGRTLPKLGKLTFGRQKGSTRTHYVC